MNSTDPKISALGQELFLFIRFPEISGGNPMFPENNFVGGILLWQLLDFKLESAGQLLAPVSFTGPLNLGSYLCTVASVPQSVSIICDLLKKNGLIHVSNIYRFDASELIYRNMFPPGGRDIQADEIRSQINVSHSLTKQLNGKLEQFFEPHQ